MFSILFFAPHMALMLAHGRWTRALRLVAAMAFAAGVVMAASRVPAIVGAADDWAHWFSLEIGELWLEGGQLGWSTPAEMPYATRHRNWRVDFMPGGTDFSPASRVGPERQGVWISPSAVYRWQRLSENGRVHTTPLLADGHVLGLIDTDRVWPDGFRLKGEELVARTHSTVLHAVPLFLLTEGLSILAQVLFYALVFAVIPYFLRSPIAANGFRGVLTFYLYASIPPLLVATVYNSLGLKGLNFNTFFVITFIGYLVLIIWQIGRAVRREPAG